MFFSTFIITLSFVVLAHADITLTSNSTSTECTTFYGAENANPPLRSAFLGLFTPTKPSLVIIAFVTSTILSATQVLLTETSTKQETVGELNKLCLTRCFLVLLVFVFLTRKTILLMHLSSSSFSNTSDMLFDSDLLHKEQYITITRSDHRDCNK